MIERIYEIAEADYAEICRTWRGKKLVAYYRAYGGNYDFCQFFKITDGEAKGWMFLLNATLIICSNDEIPAAELMDFIAMHMPFRVEFPQHLLSDFRTIPNYQSLHRTMFSLHGEPVPERFQEADVDMNPKLSDVYSILQEGFPNLTDYALWLTDTSHRCRHGVSHVLTYRNSTTVTIIFDQNNCVLVGQVATAAANRGSGYARDFLKWLAGWLESLGKHAVLYALDIRKSFYQEIGFTVEEEEYVLERQDVQKESTEKGALQ